eukprot:3600748-Amphidinium_carterae.1
MLGSCPVVTCGITPEDEEHGAWQSMVQARGANGKFEQSINEMIINRSSKEQRTHRETKSSEGTRTISNHLSPTTWGGEMGK